MRSILTRNRRWLIVRGVAAMLFGVLTFVWPAVSLLVLVLFYGAYALVDGFAALVLALSGHRSPGLTWTLVLVGLLGIVAGIVTLFWPTITALALLAVIAIWAISRGVFEIMAAIRLRREIKGEWLLFVAGVLSIAFGLLLILQPRAGLLVIVWLIGVYSLILGVLYVALGLRLRPSAGLRGL